MEFRFKAMQQAHDPDDLDTAISLANPKSWIVLFVALLIIVAAGLWSFLGTLSHSMSGVGVLSRSAGVVRVEPGFAGVITAIAVHAGDHVDVGAPVATMADPDGVAHQIRAVAAGTVMVTDYEPGSSIGPADPLAIVERDAPGDSAAGGRGGLTAMVVVPAARAAGLRVGTDVELAVASAPPQSFGLLKGTVRNVSRFPITATGLSAVIYDLATVTTMTSGGAVSLVAVELRSAPDTPSGYAWTSPAGPPFPLTFQTGVTAEFRLGSFRPIDYIFGAS